MTRRENQARAICKEKQEKVAELENTRQRLEEERNRILQALQRISSEIEKSRDTYESS